MKGFAKGFARSTRIALFGSVAIACLAMPGLAQAQEAQSAVEEDYGNEIIVTATKREQTLQDVPVAVSVTTGETIERAQIRDIKDLSSIVPSLRVSQLQSSANTNFFIRGFGNGANNAGIEPSVGLFIDGVYRSRSAAMIGDMPDVKRVEVLRGPQSTLFGKNASAGIISFVTAEPQFKLGGNVEATYGNYNALTLKGVVTGPLGETIAASLAGGINKRDGYVKDLASGVDENERDRWFVRGQVLFAPDNGLKVRLIGDYAKIDENCCAVVNLIPSGATGAILHPLVGGQVNTAAQKYKGVIYNNFASTNKVKNWGLSGQIDYDLGNLRLTSITSYRGVRAITNQDSDFTSGELLGRNFQDVDIKTFTQEFRLASDFDGPLNFLAGAFYFNEKIAQENQLLLGNDFRNYADLLIRGQSANLFTLAQVEQVLNGAATLIPAGTLGVPSPATSYVGRSFANGSGMNEAYRLKDNSFSLFGQVDFEVTDRLTLTAGLNYTHDKKTFSTNTVSNEFFSGLQLATFVPAATQVLIAQTVGGLLSVPGGIASSTQVQQFAAANPAGFAQVAAGATSAATKLYDLKALQFLPPFLNVPNTVETGKLSDGDLSYTLRLAYDATDNVNLYLSYATGYKAASVNLSRDSRPLLADRAGIIGAGLNLPNLGYTSRFADPENATVYEAGLKGNWGSASANIAVFQQSIKGFQSNIFTGLGFRLTNAGKQSTFGVEFEGSVKPVDALTLNLAATYLKPKYNDFLISAFGDLSGTRPAGVPAWSVTAGFEFRQPVGNDQLILRADYHYESPYTPVEGLPGFLVRNYVTDVIDPASIPVAIAAAQQFKRDVNELNASLTYAMDMGLELSVWGRNITNDRYIIQVFDSPAQAGSVSGYPSQPRTYGVSARYRF